MSIDNARKFYEKVKTDQGLQQKIGEQAKEKPAEMEAIIIKVAGDNGFKFNAEEMKTIIAEVAPKGGELNNAELEMVAGGSKYNWATTSILTFGIGCAISGALNATIAKGDDCLG
jgi:predicted ribosomally synthesized peptide with nif11-like leader